MKSGKRVLFYSSVKSKKLFAVQQFYRTDIHILREIGYKVSLSNSIFDFFAFWKYDIAFIYFYRFGAMVALLSKILGKKVIFTGGIDALDKEYATGKKYYIQKLLFKICYYLADKIIIVSNSDKKNIQIVLNELPENKCEMAFHTVKKELTTFPETSKKKLVTTIAWMADVENIYRKGVNKAIFFFKELIKIDTDFRMIIVGTLGKGSDHILKIIQSENLTDYIKLVGSVDDDTKMKILNESSIYLQLSKYEGFGMAAIEALATGNLVVHTNKGGLADGVGLFGIICNDVNYELAAQEAVLTLNNNEALKKVRYSAKKHIDENFRYETRLEKFRTIFNEL